MLIQQNLLNSLYKTVLNAGIYKSIVHENNLKIKIKLDYLFIYYDNKEN